MKSQKDQKDLSSQILKHSRFPSSIAAMKKVKISSQGRDLVDPLTRS